MSVDLPETKVESSLQPAPASPKEAKAAPAPAPMAPSAPLIQNVFARTTTSLNGDWRTIVDPYENGYYDYRYEPRVDEGYFQNQKPKSKSDRVEYDFDRSPLLRVPGDWNSQRQELLFYEGTVWYRQTFDHPPRPGRRTFVHFGAANYDAKVYLNGERLGEHEGGFTPFNYEITGRVFARDNFLIVKVDNQRHRHAVPTVNTDWWNYGGLTREVTLVDVPETFIRDYAVYLERGSTRRVRGWVRLDGPTKKQRLIARIPEANVEVSVEVDGSGYAEFGLEADLALWSPESPRLYEVELRVDTDSVRDRIGFRTVEVEGGEIRLNGQPIFLRGISLHEEAPNRPGRATDDADARTLLGWAKELGANFVRLAHYPHGERMTRMADELGLLVWSEIPVYWTIQWDDPRTLSAARSQLGEMIARDKNRASIIIWSVGNETPVSAPRLRFMFELTALARRLDTTRLLSAALERHSADGRVQVIDDPLGQALDVLGCNEYLGWYEGLPESADSVTWTTTYDKPLVITEFGADALAGYHGDALTRWTEEYQASVYEHQVAMLERIPFLRGISPWILADFRSPRRPLPGIQDFYNRKGLISDRGAKKQAFNVLRDYYRKLAVTWEQRR